MRKRNLFIRQALAAVLIFWLSACAEDPLGGNDPAGKGYTVTLRLAATVAPTPETKAIVLPARAGSEAEAAGFYVEMVSSDADRVAGTPGFGIEVMPPEKDSIEINFGTKALATKAPKALKNTYALLFMSDGRFNGRAEIGEYAVGAPQDITLTGVVSPKADGCRLVIVANDDLAVTPYASSAGTGGFAGFTGTYAEFQKLTLTNVVNQDTDVPYAGSATVNLSQSEMGETVEAPLFWTLAKVTLENTFAITGGPARSTITLCNAGARRFAPSGTNSYDGTGNTPTADGFVATTAGGNTNSVTWYVGGNIQPSVAAIKTASDRNSTKAPKSASYIQITSVPHLATNTSPKIGEEYIPAGTKTFAYTIYLGNSADVTDFALRRHTRYTLASEISGTLAEQEELALTDGRIALTRPAPAGLVIGRFGGPEYTKGIVPLSDIKGSYTKFLLLEPNITRSAAIDNMMKPWGAPGTQYQKENRMYWDKTYIYSITTDGTIGGMSTADGGVYAYCNKLTLGGVPAGTWHVPTAVQMQAIWAVYTGMRKKDFGNYTAFNTNISGYWSSTEGRPSGAWYERFDEGSTLNYNTEKGTNCYMRCVRDL